MIANRQVPAQTGSFYPVSDFFDSGRRTISLSLQIAAEPKIICAHRCKISLASVKLLTLFILIFIAGIMLFCAKVVSQMPTKKPSATKHTFEQHYFEKVYDVTRLIPRGKVSTYGAIADFLGLGSARMVGWALNHCHHAEDYVPAHRVVNRLGELSGRLHFATPDLMQKRLEYENIIVVNNKISNMASVFWHPRELENYYCVIFTKYHFHEIQNQPFHTFRDLCTIRFFA